MGYADDNLGLRVFPAFSKLSTLFSDVPSCLSAISKWTDEHFLKLNKTKTHVMVFGNKTFKQSVNLSGCLNSTGSLLPLSHSTKLLGAHLDDTLPFNLGCRSYLNPDLYSKPNPNPYHDGHGQEKGG